MVYHHLVKKLFFMTPITEEKRTCIEASWFDRIGGEFEKPYMSKLESFLAQEIQSCAVIYPPLNCIFNAFFQTPFEKVKVVVIGQDPYHGPGQAHGLAFSVPEGIPIPPSLLNIYKELKSDLGLEIPTHGCLLHWAKQGVLLLNATLTVRAGEARSHYGQGWEVFTDRVVQLLCERNDPMVFLLWGKSALEKFRHICLGKREHLVLTAPHPSPLSAHTGFWGCRHFSKANEFFKNLGKQPIDWAVP
jgi:uracil-DNA glycosylase